MTKTSRRWPFAACLLSLACGTATAGPYSTMVVFGDSLADAGQFPDTAGPRGSTLRFTNRVGPTYQDGSGEVFNLNSSTLIGRMLNVSAGDLAASTSPVNAALGLADGNNWAVGGYRTDQILDSINSQSTVVDPNSGTLLRSRTGYLPANSFRADPNALYYLTGGGNDFLQGRVLSASSAGQAANRLADSALALQQAGARYIMVWLLPDIGQTPALSGTPLASATSALSAVFNQQLVSRLAQIDAQVIPLNVPLLISETLAAPARFGFDPNENLVATCFSGDSCRESAANGRSSATPDPSRVFFNDRVHPTEAGQRLLADYAYSLLSAPWEISLLPEMANGTLRMHQDELRAQWLSDWGNWQGVGQWQSIIAAGGQKMDFDAQDSSADADGRGYNLTIGGSYRFAEHWRTGVVAGAYRQNLEAGARDSDYKLNSYIATAFLQYQANHWWGDLAVSGGKLDYGNAERKFALGVSEGQEKGDTDGEMWAVSGRVGFDIAGAASRWHLSPFVSADYAHIDVDGYSEKGNRSTALTFSDQTRKSRRAGVGLQGKFEVTPATQLWAEVAREREFETDQQDVTMALNSVQSVDFTLEGYTPQRDLNRATFGVSQKLTQDLTLRGNYNWRKNDDVTQQGANVALSMSF
ncbi:autotransporter domain-containing SGNH/GDSL hydrolase family protein [Pseudomonas syringae pv. theae]|uniref:esterase EstP n=1 Tax=Pseudomonas syringae TaxID=317 RepID=UPI0023D44352|nr:esterase EstP [Pseudomonas syringae]MBL3829861.1 autotransporter domain-containing protein [Pseudomonas syringae pv. theae]MBL3866366.1 autotransporter domain-containing protein [Pseudomonas syringae pv. theae]GKS05441.1 autotransporter domain-containing SGNH/GDSL hydrolase family protein [Pseudomonas syringae pv. theae]